MEVGEIVDEVKNYMTRIVVVTGGEPSLYNLEELTEALHREGRMVHVETNGTGILPDSVDWITCSPKKNAQPPYYVTDSIARRADELKVVYTGQSDEELSALATRFATHCRFLQPCSGENIKETVDAVLRRPDWRLSLQTHRMISIK